MKSVFMKRLAMAVALIKWDLCQAMGLDTKRAQMRYVELSFEVETDPKIVSAIGAELACANRKKVTK